MKGNTVENRSLELLVLKGDFSICKLKSAEGLTFERPFTFFSATDDECSLVCETAVKPGCEQILESSDGWKGVKICGVLDFSLIGILAGIAQVLRDAGVGIFVVSTFNTDYVFTRAEQFLEALEALGRAQYQVITDRDR